jgi:predicted amidohydrolase
MSSCVDNFATIIQGGRVVCPASGLDAVLDVAIAADGTIAAVGPDLAGTASVGVDGAGVKTPVIFDATGKIVTAGLVDMHAHVYKHATPLGLDADEFCLGRGVTTVVDAGSAGATTFDGLRHFVAASVLFDPYSHRILARKRSNLLYVPTQVTCARVLDIVASSIRNNRQKIPFPNQLQLRVGLGSD